MMVQVLALLCVVGMAFGHAAAAEEFVRAEGVGRAKPGTPAAQARLMAERAAQQVALRNLAAKVFGEEISRDDGTKRVQVEGFIRGHRFLPAKVNDDGSVEVTVELPISAIGSEHRRVTVRLNEALAKIEAQQRELERAKTQLREQTELVERLRARLTAQTRKVAEFRNRIQQLTTKLDRSPAATQPATTAPAAGE